MNTNESPAAMTSRFGWPRPKREEEFDKLGKAKDLPTERIEFQGRIQDFPIIRVPINLPKYRMVNGRTASSQEEYLAKHGQERRDLFSGDPELLDAQEVQHGLLLALASQADLLNYFKDSAHRQVNPILLDEMGFVVNGNRRLATWRELYLEDRNKYGHFGHIDVTVLPHADQREIDRLEVALQIEPDIKADYTWDSRANMMFQKRKRDNLSISDLSALYKMKKEEVTELLEMRDYAAEYLRSRNKESHWSSVSANELAFEKIVAGRSKIADTGEKELFKQAAFILIDNSSEAGGRLYEAIPNIQEYLPEVKAKLFEKFPVTSKAASGKMGDLFGGSKPREEAVNIPLAAEIQKAENSDAARKIIVAVIESQRQLKKDSKTANYLVDCLAKANALLGAAIKDGLRPESKKTGAQAQLKQIKAHISRVEKWLEDNA